MAYEETEIGKLVKTDPAKAAKQLVELFERAGGNSVHAALLAGVHHSTLKRWVSKLDKHKVRKKIDSVRETGTPAKMTPAKRTELSARTLERRRVAGLQRTFDRLDVDGRLALGKETGAGPTVLVRWRDERDSLPSKVKDAVDDAVGRLQARYRAALRSANRVKQAQA